MKRLPPTREAPKDRAQILEDLERGIFVSEALRSLGSVGLHDADFSSLSGRTRASIHQWRTNNTTPPAEIAEHIDDARYTALDLLRNNEDLSFNVLASWFRSRSFDLDGERPLAALAEGRFDEVIEAGRHEIASVI